MFLFWSLFSPAPKKGKWLRTCDAFFKLLFPHTFIIPAYLWPWRGLSLVFWGCRGDLEFTLLSLRSVCSWSGSEYEIFNTFEIQASLISWQSVCWGWDCTCNVWASAQCLNVYACEWLFVPLAQLVTSAQACVVNTVWNRMYACTHTHSKDVQMPWHFATCGSRPLFMKWRANTRTEHATECFSLGT